MVLVKLQNFYIVLHFVLEGKIPILIYYQQVTILDFSYLKASCWTRRHSL